MYWWKIFALIVIGEFVGNAIAAILSAVLEKWKREREDVQ